MSKKIAKNTVLFFGGCAIIVLVTAFQTPLWVAPKAADNVKNPIANTPDVIKNAGIIFQKQCLMCHGAKGKGDGAMAVNLNPKPANLQSAMVQKDTDGDLFWKITNGKAPMPTFAKTLTEEQRWQMVNYVRYIAKAGK